jgi:hypothetical protein
MPKATEKSTLQLLLEELLEIYRPLSEPSTLPGLLNRLAISGPIPAPIDNLRQLAAALPSGDQSGNIKAGLEAVTGFYRAVKAIDSTTLPPAFGGFARKLNDYLIADYLRQRRPAFYHLASLLGWIRFTLDDSHPFDTDPPVYGSSPIAWESLPAFFTDTSTEFSKSGHGWNTPRFEQNYTFLLFHLGQLLNQLHEASGFPVAPTVLDVEDLDSASLYLPFLSASAGGASADFGFRLARLDADGLVARPEGTAALNQAFQLTPTLSLLLEAGITLDGGIAIQIRPAEVSLKQGGLQAEARVMTGLQIQKDERILLLGTETGNRIDLKSMSGKIGLRLASGNTLEFLGEIALAEGRIIIKNAGGDGFLNKLLPKDGIEAPFDLTIGWSSAQGVYFAGSAGLEIKIPTHIDLGPIEVHGISIGLKPLLESGRPPGFDLPIGSDVQLQLGPFTAVVQGMGIRALLSYNEAGGNLGPFDLDIGFKPPKGIGLTLETPAIKGGGYLYFDFDKGEYAGAAELAIKETIAIKAIGILTTKKPDGSPGFSFLLLITAEFKPIQLGFGFTLNGVGGLIAINRGMNLEALAAGVRTNAINSVMFPADPVAEAPRIIADLNQFFPVAEGRYTFGLMAIIGWGTPTLISVELGLMIQVPDPVILAILGVVRVQLPDKKAPIINLQANFIGAVDFEERYMFFFAALFESRLATYRIEGEMYFSISWGNQPNFLFTVGGFHPAFKPPPLRHLNGPLKRITINLLPTDNPRLTIQAYFAVTANTVQFGASVDFLFKVKKFRVVGYLYLDALFQFNPFYFIVDFGAGLSVMLGSRELLGIHLRGTISGPTPWHIQGTASFKILFIKVKVRVSKRFGKVQRQALPARPILPVLLEALRDVRNWQAALPASSELHASFREIPDGELVLHPAGSLSISQSRLPLNVRFDKVGNERPSDYQAFTFAIDQYQSTRQLKDYFAPAEFMRLSDSQRLSRKSFELMQAGLSARGGNAFFTADYVERDYEFEQLIVDGPDFFATAPATPLSMEQDEYEAFVEGSAVARSAQGRQRRLAAQQPAQPVKQKTELYGIVSRDTLKVATMGGAELLYGSQAEAIQALRAIETAKPQLARRYQVAPAFEIETL